MSDIVDVGGAEMISSKRAAELSGYAQDYIGQLARKGLIEAKRIGGLWYVSLHSLNAYKSQADTYTPRPPQPVHPSSDTDSIITFDGRDYVSAARAAKITGYHPDYVGQLARSGKILSRQIGNRWYVDRDGIAAHKAEKDALLGAVQAESVGIKRETPPKQWSEIPLEPFFKYRTEGRDLIPKPESDRDASRALYEEYSESSNPISIRRSYEKNDISTYEENTQANEPSKPAYNSQKHSKRRPNALLLGAALLSCLIAVSGAIFITLKRTAPGRLTKVTSPTTQADARPVESLSAFEGFTDWVEHLLGKELTYKRDK